MSFRNKAESPHPKAGLAGSGNQLADGHQRLYLSSASILRTKEQSPFLGFFLQETGNIQRKFLNFHRICSIIESSDMTVGIN